MSGENFLQREIRNEYLVDEQQKKIWKVQLDLYTELKRVCDKYQLKCFPAAGTLLGAVRHDGFIPWDDDLDVAMSRKDFTKLCEVADQEFQEPYFFQYALSDRNYFAGYARLRNSNTTGIVSYFSGHKFNNGMFVDILVYDVIPQDARKLNTLIKRVKIHQLLLNNYYHLNSSKKTYRLLLPFFSVIKHLISYEDLYDRYVRVCRSYENTDSSRMGLLCIPGFIKYEATKDGIHNLIPHKFEYTEMMIPNDYDYMLKKAYGDYMKFPPKEKRGIWHDGVIIYDPDIPYLEYYKSHSEAFSKALEEYQM